MKSPHTRSILLVSVSLFTLACSSGRPSDQERLQRMVEELRKRDNLPGIAVALAEGRSSPVVATAGFANLGEALPVEPDTPFFIGSISKNFFATIALMLVDEGRLDLDGPLSAWVDWPRGDEVTLRMLMNHTSGIPEYLTKDLFESRGGGVPEFFTRPRSPSEILAMLPRQAPEFEPGSRQEYSNTNGLLVGQVIEKATGKPLAAIFEERIVAPLGLKHMYLYGQSTAGRFRARGYSARAYWGARDGELVDCSFADDALPDSADGSVVTNVLDLLRYHRALRGGELLRDASWKAMSTVEPGLHNGLGYLLGEGPLGPYAGNTGRTMGHVSASLYYPDHDTYLVMMINRGDARLLIGPFMETWIARRD